MFTPPPSPLPPAGFTEVQQPVRKCKETNKRAMGRRSRRMVLAVPLVLALITLSARYTTHPAAFDALSLSDFASLWKTGKVWKSHPPHLRSRQNAASGSELSTFQDEPATRTTTTTSAGAGTQPLPTVPASPPVLPTPFPAPWEELGTNFSSVSCFNFFQNTTAQPPFRQCRPLSLLLQSSTEMVEAQTNLTAMNSLLWGTCNTRIPFNECVTNMAGFLSDLRRSCQDDINAQNVMVLDAIMGFEAFSVMHETGCLVDPTTNSYCYLDAVRNVNPTELYYYLLPLGTGLPNNAKLTTCSACTRDVLKVYYDALSDTSTTITGLQKTYNKAAQDAVTDCGQNYASLLGNGSLSRLPFSSSGIVCLLLLLAISFLC